jgi:hypothetical protein
MSNADVAVLIGHLIFFFFFLIRTDSKSDWHCKE